MRVAIITNIPAPYRIPVYNLLGEHWKDNLFVIFCAATEPNRQWNVPEMKFYYFSQTENV